MTGKKILLYLLDLFLPRSENVRSLEEMNPEKFRAATRGSERDATSIPENTVAVFDYKHPLVRQAIWELKYRGNTNVAELLAQCLHEELAEELSERKSLENFGKPLLVPVPLSKKRLRERGFNQCELLADALEILDDGNFFEVRRDLLTKVRDTESQTKKNRAARLKNLENCFSVKTPEEISGRNVIILDDVITTGATLDEARRTLKACGARKILCLAIAH
ncbi:MAG: ComF family protein [bacterium]|nr:ComF family protein [bacterium]